MPATTSSTADQILDAALETALAVGFKRITVTEVARRAGLSRMTAYRTFADNAALARALMTREFARVLDSIEAEVTVQAGDDPGQRLAALLTEAVRAIPRHPLMRKVIEVDPQLLLPYVVDHLGSTQLYARAALEQLAGDAGLADPHALATTALLCAQSLVLAHGALEDAGLSDRVEAQWAQMVPRMLGLPA
jgi:AcrR family transcriptional regulator